MALRFYIMPTATIQSGRFVGREGPAYVPFLGTFTMRLGAEPVILIARDVSPAEHTALAANSPITVVPPDLSTTIGAGQVVTVQAELESWNIPAQWIEAGMTYKAALRILIMVCCFAQRFRGLHNARIFVGGITLATTVSQLTQTQRDKLAAVSDSFGWDRSQVTGATTMRQLIHGAAQQFAGDVKFAGQVF